jgi:hypothetical protein
MYSPKMISNFSTYYTSTVASVLLYVAVLITSIVPGSVYIFFINTVFVKVHVPNLQTRL